jgi:hypothetical protein
MRRWELVLGVVAALLAWLTNWALIARRDRRMAARRG